MDLERLSSQDSKSYWADTLDSPGPAQYEDLRRGFGYKTYR